MFKNPGTCHLPLQGKLFVKAGVAPCLGRGGLFSCCGRFDLYGDGTDLLAVQSLLGLAREG